MKNKHLFHYLYNILDFLITNWDFKITFKLVLCRWLESRTEIWHWLSNRKNVEWMQLESDKEHINQCFCVISNMLKEKTLGMDISMLQSKLFGRVNILDNQWTRLTYIDHKWMWYLQCIDKWAVEKSTEGASIYWSYPSHTAICPKLAEPEDVGPSFC